MLFKRETRCSGTSLRLMEHNRPVYVDLRHEPENPHDENTIAVYLQNDDIFKHVGYIARELTQYVRLRLNEPSFNAQVKTIRFRTTYMLVGFYLTIKLTKHGLWHTNVIKASKSVR